MLKPCGSVVATNCKPEGQEGTATFSWSISPVRAPEPPKKKGHECA